MSLRNDRRLPSSSSHDDDPESWFITLAYAEEEAHVQSVETRRNPTDRLSGRSDALDGHRDDKSGIERITYRLDEVAAALGVSRRTIEREREAGRFPAPDLYIGRMPLWVREKLVRWIARGDQRA